MNEWTSWTAVVSKEMNGISQSVFKDDTLAADSKIKLRFKSLFLTFSPNSTFHAEGEDSSIFLMEIFRLFVQ